MLNQVATLINNAVAGAEATVENRENGQDVIYVNHQHIYKICETLKNNNEIPFRTLMVITGSDHEECIEVSYVLATFDPNNNHEFILKTKLERANPTLDSVVDIWKAADWQERECYDMLGVIFTNHPDLKRILCCYDWEGFPLRKDYVAAKTYKDLEIYPEGKSNLPEREFVNVQKENFEATRPELDWE